MKTTKDLAKQLLEKKGEKRSYEQGVNDLLNLIEKEKENLINRDILIYWANTLENKVLSKNELYENGKWLLEKGRSVSDKKTIEVDEQMYMQLMELSKELTTQDHRGTAMPYYFQIRTDKFVYGENGIGAEVWVKDDDVLDSEESIKEAILESEGFGWEILSDAAAENRFAGLTLFEKKEFLLEIGYRKMWRSIAHKYENWFLTEKGIKRHIELNKHNYNNPVSYLNYAYRNNEIELIQKFLCELSGGKLHK